MVIAASVLFLTQERLRRYATLLANSFADAQDPAESAQVARPLVYICGGDTLLITPDSKVSPKTICLPPKVVIFSVVSID